MLSWKIASRFLRSSPAQSALIIAGIAVGIAVQIFVGSLITSLQANLVETTVGSSPQVTITDPTEGDPVVYSSRMQEVITTDPRVKPGAIAPVRTISGLYTNDNDSAPLNLKGGELSGLNAIYGLQDRIVDGKASLRTGEILVGKDFADKYMVKVGDSIGLTLQGNRNANLKVVGIFDLGSSTVNERQAFVSSELPRSVLGWGANEFSAVETQMNDPFDSQAVARDWRSKLGPTVDVVDWQVQNADLLTALQSQSSSSYMIQTFVLVAVALGIASTLAISAVQKTRQIGILKAMGMADKSAGRIFLYQALLLGGTGSLAGIGLAYLLLLGFSFAPVSFSIQPQPAFVALSAGIGVLVALLSSIIPTRSTSRLDPIEVIQGG